MWEIFLTFSCLWTGAAMFYSFTILISPSDESFAQNFIFQMTQHLTKIEWTPSQRRSVISYSIWLRSSSCLLNCHTQWQNTKKVNMAMKEPSLEVEKVIDVWLQECPRAGSHTGLLPASPPAGEKFKIHQLFLLLYFESSVSDHSKPDVQLPWLLFVEI